MWNCAPFLVAIGSFATFVLVDPEHNILDSRQGSSLVSVMSQSPRTAFVSLSLFNTLQGPFFLLPFGIVSIIQVIVCVRRIYDGALGMGLHRKDQQVP